MTKEEKISIFRNELSLIKDSNIRRFAELILADADEYFFNVPASSSGKYHPDFSRGDGGLVRHTKAVVYFAYEICRSELEFKYISETDADLIIVAAIAHDIKKQGDGLSHHTVKEHPLYGAEYIKKIYNQTNNLLHELQMEFVYNLIRKHMGPWCDIKPETRAEMILYYADYIASRSGITGLKIFENNESSISPIVVTPTQVNNTAMTVDDYVFDFGRTKGLTIKESYAKDPGYINWMANKSDFGKVEVQNLVKEFLHKK